MTVGAFYTSFIFQTGYKLWCSALCYKCTIVMKCFSSMKVSFNLLISHLEAKILMFKDMHPSLLLNMKIDIFPLWIYYGNVFIFSKQFG